MSLTFNEAFEALLKNIVQDPEHENQTYIQDINDISTKICLELDLMNSFFKDRLVNLKHTGQFTSGDFTVKTKDWDSKLIVQMPFQVQPEVVQIHWLAGTRCILKTSSVHPIVPRGFVSAPHLQTMLGHDLKEAIGRIDRVTCTSGKTYKLQLEYKGGLIITAQNLQGNDQIQFSLTIVVKFLNDTEPYICFGNDFYKYNDLYDFQLEEEDAKRYKNALKQLLRIIENLTEASEWDTDILRVDTFDRPPIAEKIIEAIKSSLKSKPNAKLQEFYDQLLRYKLSHSVTLKELMTLFGKNEN